MEVYINKALSSQVIMELLDKYPHLEKIKCPQSLYARTSPKYLDALKELGIEVEPVIRRGRPRKYDSGEVETIHDMLTAGSTPKEIAEKLNMPLKTVYYLKDIKLKRGRKPKYSPEREEEVKKLHRDGVKAKDISKQLNIPLRTVYFLIKR